MSICSNGFREFDSHTTTKIINNMKQIIKLMSVYYYTILIVAITVLVMNKSNEQEVINTSENMIEWIIEDEASGNVGREQADTYIDNLEQMIEEIK